MNKTLLIHELGYPAYWYKITILGAKHPIIPCNIEKQITNMQCRQQSREERTKCIMNMNIFLGVHISHSSSYRMLISTFTGWFDRYSRKNLGIGSVPKRLSTSATVSRVRFAISLYLTRLRADAGKICNHDLSIGPTYPRQWRGCMGDCTGVDPSNDPFHHSRSNPSTITAVHCMETHSLHYRESRQCRESSAASAITYLIKTVLDIFTPPSSIILN